MADFVQRLRQLDSEVDALRALLAALHQSMRTPHAEAAPAPPQADAAAWAGSDEYLRAYA